MDLLELLLAMALGAVFLWLFTANAQRSASVFQGKGKAALRGYTADNILGRSAQPSYCSADTEPYEANATLGARQFAVNCRRRARAQAFEVCFREAVPTYLLIPSFEWPCEFGQLVDNAPEFSWYDFKYRLDGVGQRYGVFVPYDERPLGIVDFFHTPFDLSWVSLSPPDLRCDLPVFRFSDRYAFDDAAIQIAVAAMLVRRCDLPPNIPDLIQDLAAE